MPFAPGDLVAGRFEIVRQLGAGGLAEVFLARDRQTGTEVALKALHQHLLFDEGLKERFRRELAVTRQLDHPGIVRVYELYEEAGRPFFVMEHLRGETLAERLRAGPLAPGEARRVAAEICDALTAAHRKGVVHRDLKPQNIFLAETGAARPQVKLLDFGLARAAGWARLTAQSTIMGTPGYAAPEVMDAGGSDPRSDLYSLAATLFEMLTGRRAFPSTDPYQALRQQKQAAPSARALNPTVDAATDSVVQRGLHADAEQRFADAAQMKEALLGRSIAPPAPVPPAMTTGKMQVVVQWKHDSPRPEVKQDLERLLWTLGLDEGSPAAKRWIERVRFFGSAPLVSGCSAQTASTIAALCQERGIAASIQGQETKRAGQMVKAAVSAAGVGALVVGSQVALSFSNSMNVPGPSWWFRGSAVAMGAMVAWSGLRGLWAWKARVPFQDLPEGDPAVRRLLDGIVRRAARLSQRQKGAPEAVQYLRDDLVRAANELVTEAEALGARAAAIPDALAPLTPLPSGSRSEAPTLLRERRPEERDLLVGQLLEIAAALDEAFAASATSSEAAGSALTRLREETAFARRVVPEIEALVLGEAPAALDDSQPGQVARGPLRIK